MDRKPVKKSLMLSTGEVAARMGVTGETVRAWINRGVRPFNGIEVVRLQCMRIGKRYFVRRRWLKEFMETLGAAQERVPVMPQVEPVDKQQERFKREKEAVARRLGRRGAK